MKNWKKYGNPIARVIFEYLYDDSNIIKLDETKIASIGNDEEFKERYPYYYKFDPYEFMLFRHIDNSLILSVYDNEQFKSNTIVLKKLHFFNYILERICVNTQLLYNLVRPDCISYHFLINIDKVNILDLEVENFYINDKKYLNGDDLVAFSIENLFLDNKKQIKLLEKEEVKFLED